MSQCSVFSHTSVTQQSAPLVNCTQKKVKTRRGGRGGRKLPSYPQKRICNSAAGSPNYSGAVLKSATRQREREKNKKRQKEGEKYMRERADGERGERGEPFCK